MSRWNCFGIIRSPHDVKKRNSRDRSLDHVTSVSQRGLGSCGKNRQLRTGHALPVLAGLPEGDDVPNPAQSREPGSFGLAMDVHLFCHSQFRR